MIGEFVMSISNKDYDDLRSRIASSNTRIQFGVGDYLDSKGYTGEIGEPILLKDKYVFAVCDGKSIANRRYYPINNSMSSVLDDALDALLEHLIDFFIEKVAVGTLTSKFPIEGSKLNRHKLIEAFTNTNKFCLPDGRSLPLNCYATRVLGITSAPSLAGRFLRHYDASDSRSLGSTQSDSLKNHQHRINRDKINYSSYDHLFKQAYQAYREDSWYWKDGSYDFSYNIALGDYISKYKFPNRTDYRGDSETRPKNLSYLSFFRYDL
ncbi:Hypothetical protein BHO_0121300 (plasmid) [Borrelia hermsii YBT]|uniref:Uncharacterized protein n=2 Tax=Borrelia hermsii TaxID=140 RepID=W5T3G1_BORHE|nr:Hypothetical protein BHO_0121300 [Borrelia hermsii YBT]